MKNIYQIIEENEDFIVIDKGSGISTINESNSKYSVKSILQEKMSKELYTVHRIDKETSGLVIFAKNPDAHRMLSMLFEERKIYKEYITIVHGAFPYDSLEINYPIEEASRRMKVSEKGKESITTVSIVERLGNFTLLKAIPHTGRRHQIRLHLSFLGYPIIGDRLYGYNKPFFLSEIKKKYKKKEEERPIIERTALHSNKIEFIYKDKIYSFSSSIPKDMKALLYQLRKIYQGAIVWNHFL